MGVERTPGRASRTSRTRSGRPVGEPGGRTRASRRAAGPADPTTPRSADPGPTAATATLDRERPEPFDAGDAAPEAPTTTGSRRTRGNRARTRQPQRTPRHRMLLLSTAVLALGLLAVLLINTVISQGAFRQHELEVQLILLAEKEQALDSQLDLAESPIEVEKAARALGMVPAAAPVFLRLSDGKILGEPIPAVAAAGKVDFSNAPGIQPTPSPSPSEGGSAAPDQLSANGLIDPALDPATDPATGSLPSASAAASPQPSVSPSAALATPQPTTQGE